MARADVSLIDIADGYPIDSLTKNKALAYLTLHGLVCKGNKAECIRLVGEHLKYKKHGTLKGEFPPSSFVLESNGVVCVQDVICYEHSPGTTVVARVLHISSKCNYFSFQVLWSEGVDPLQAFSVLQVTFNFVDQLKISRQKTTDESLREANAVAIKAQIQSLKRKEKSIILPRPIRHPAVKSTDNLLDIRNESDRVLNPLVPAETAVSVSKEKAPESCPQSSSDEAAELVENSSSSDEDQDETRMYSGPVLQFVGDERRIEASTYKAEGKEKRGWHQEENEHKPPADDPITTSTGKKRVHQHANEDTQNLDKGVVSSARETRQTENRRHDKGEIPAQHHSRGKKRRQEKDQEGNATPLQIIRIVPEPPPCRTKQGSTRSERSFAPKSTTMYKQRRNWEKNWNVQKHKKCDGCKKNNNAFQGCKHKKCYHCCKKLGSCDAHNSRLKAR